MFIRILTDGKMGDLAQCRGVALHLGGTVEERIVKARGWRAAPMPVSSVPKDERPGVPGGPLSPHPEHGHPDLIIASGRRTLPYLRAFRAAHPAVPVVYLKNPQSSGVADVIWAPRHDDLEEGPRVIVTDTSPHALTAQELEQARARAFERFGEIAQPVTGIILGGDNATVRWTRESADEFAGLLADAVEGGALVTASRRTPPLLLKAVSAALPEAWIDDGSENAYRQIIAFADRLIVTGDSHNMVSEALASAAPVFVFRPPNLRPKFNRFLDKLERENRIAPLTSPLRSPAANPFDATPAIAEAIRERLAALGKPLP